MARPNRPAKGTARTTSLAIGPHARKKKKQDKRRKALEWLTNGNKNMITARNKSNENYAKKAR